MPSDVTREEFQARVGLLESEVEGEKLVTRHILEQTRRNGDDLVAVKTRLDRVEGRLGGVEGRLVGVEGRLDGVEGRLVGVEGRLVGVERSVDGVQGKVNEVAQDVHGLRSTVDGLVRNLPTIVGDAVRDALRSRGRKS